MASWIETFLTAAPEERLRLARDPANEQELRRHLGDAAYGDYRQLADKLDEQHLSLRAPKNLIFIPGVMGSLLKSDSLGGIWWIDARTRDHLKDLRLSAAGTEDANPDHQVLPCSTDPSYEPFLAAVLGRDDFGHVTFPYDWRKSLTRSAAALRDLVFKLHDQNGQNGGQPVHLVAHSMGGLMARAALMEHGDELWPKLGRVVFIGTPHYGSTAIAGYLKNHFWGWELMALLGLYLDRETFRSLWGVLSLLPAPKGIYPGTRAGDPSPWRSKDQGDPYVHPCANFDLYDAAKWELDLSDEQRKQLQAVLDGAADFHRRLYDFHRNLAPAQRERMLVIAGVGYKTLFRLAYDRGLFGWKHMDKVTDRVEGDPHREGDGRVPLASAALENVAIRYVRGVHGGLPNIPQVYEDVFRWLNDEPLQLPDTVEGALSQHLAPGDGESEAPHLDGTARANRFSDDPGYWSLSDPDPQALQGLDAKLAQEQLPEFIQVRLL